MSDPSTEQPTEQPKRVVRYQLLTPEGFARFGDFCHTQHPGLNRTCLGQPPIQFYPDLLCQVGVSNPTISVCVVRERPWLVNVTEMHSYTSECILSLRPVIIHVGEPTADGTPPLDRMQAFMVPAGTFVRLKPGVWHHAPFTIDNEPTSVVVILPERTYANDCLVVLLAPGEQFRIEPPEHRTAGF